MKRGKFIYSNIISKNINKKIDSSIINLNKVINKEIDKGIGKGNDENTIIINQTKIIKSTIIIFISHKIVLLIYLMINTHIQITKLLEHIN